MLSKTGIYHLFSQICEIQSCQECEREGTGKGMEGKRQEKKGKGGTRQVNTIDVPHTHRYQ